MGNQENLYWLAGLMSMVALATMFVVYFVLWQTAIAQKKANLVRYYFAPQHDQYS